MSAVGQQLDMTKDLIDLAKRASEAAIDSVRALGSHMLGQLHQADALIPRLTDKSISVRASAIAATGFLLQRQEDTELLEALLWNVWHDPSVPNRVAALQALPASEQVWDHVIARLRDVKEKVRLAAVGVLRQKVSTLQQLSSTQLAEIVQNGIGVVGSPAGHR
jgi:HEAT repeat protein